MKRSDYTLTGAPARTWGLPVIRLWRCDEQQAITAPASQAPQVTVTVVHVHLYAPAALGISERGPGDPGHRRDDQITAITPVIRLAGQDVQ